MTLTSDDDDNNNKNYNNNNNNNIIIIINKTNESFFYSVRDNWVALKRAVCMSVRLVFRHAEKKGIKSGARSLTSGGLTASSARSGLLGQKNGLNVGQNSSLSDRHARKQLVQFFVISDGQLQVARNDSGLFVIPGGVAGQFEHFSRQIFHHGGQVDRSTGSDSFGVVALAKKSVDTTDRELKSCATRPGL